MRFTGIYSNTHEQAMIINTQFVYSTKYIWNTLLCILRCLNRSRCRLRKIHLAIYSFSLHRWECMQFLWNECEENSHSKIIQFESRFNGIQTKVWYSNTVYESECSSVIMIITQQLLSKLNFMEMELCEKVTSHRIRISNTIFGDVFWHANVKKLSLPLNRFVKTDPIRK